MVPGFVEPVEGVVGIVAGFGVATLCSTEVDVAFTPDLLDAEDAKASRISSYLYGGRYCLANPLKSRSEADPTNTSHSEPHL